MNGKGRVFYRAQTKTEPGAKHASHAAKAQMIKRFVHTTWRRAQLRENRDFHPRTLCCFGYYISLFSRTDHNLFSPRRIIQSVKKKEQETFVLLAFLRTKMKKVKQNVLMSIKEHKNNTLKQRCMHLNIKYRNKTENAFLKMPNLSLKHPHLLNCWDFKCLNGKSE